MIFNDRGLTELVSGAAGRVLKINEVLPRLRKFIVIKSIPWLENNITGIKHPDVWRTWLKSTQQLAQVRTLHANKQPNRLTWWWELRTNTFRLLIKMCHSPANKHLSIPVNLYVEYANYSGHCAKCDKSVTRQKVNLLTSQDLVLINKMSGKSSERACERLDGCRLHGPIGTAAGVIMWLEIWDIKAFAFG